MVMSNLVKWSLVIMGGMIGYVSIELIMGMFKPVVHIITKDNGLKSIKKFPKKGRFVIDGLEYPLDPSAVIPDRGKLFWRRHYYFDEDNPEPRKVVYKGNNWMGLSAITKIINDEHIKMMSGKILEQKHEIMIALSALASTASLLVSAYMLMVQLGVIK